MQDSSYKGPDTTPLRTHGSSAGHGGGDGPRGPVRNKRGGNPLLAPFKLLFTLVGFIPAKILELLGIVSFVRWVRYGIDQPRRDPSQPKPFWQPETVVGASLLGFTGFFYVAFLMVGGDRAALTGDAVIKRGEALYKQECTTCHGPAGDRRPLSPLSSAAFLDSRGDATLMAVILEGKDQMQAFGLSKGGPFSDADVRAVVAYLNKKAGRTTNAALADAGRQLFSDNCAKCHGPNGDRIPIAPLNAKGFLDMRSDTDLQTAIRQGKGAMPPFAGKLNDEDLQALVSFLRQSNEQLVVRQISRGRELYLSNCLVCHGPEGNRIPGISLASAEYYTKVGDGQLLSAINGGKGVMPAFGAGESSSGTMGVPDFIAMLSYLKSWAGLRATTAVAIASSGTEGRELYLANCTACHRADGNGVPGVQLLSKEFLTRETDDTLIQNITRGNAKGMPAWGIEAGGPMTKDQITRIVAYLKETAKVTGNGGTVVSVPMTQAAIDRGREIFMNPERCVACHGATRDKIATCKLAEASFLKEKGDATLIQSITFGKGAMPAWGSVKNGPLNPDDVQAVVAYLKNAAGLGVVQAETPGPTDGSLTKDAAARGKATFNSTCAMCHGETRDKVATCKLADATWLKNKTFEGVVKDITEGKPPMMPTWGKSKGGTLSDDQIKDIVTYLWEAAGITSGSGGGGAAPAASAGPVLSAADIAKGKEVFTARCVMCHGETRDKVPTCKLADAKWLEAKGFDDLVRDITEGKAPLMPAWGAILKADEIKAAASYVWDASGAAKGGAAATPPPASTGPVLSAADITKGKEVFTARCVMCHGETRDKVPTCKLADAKWLEDKGFADLVRDITEGKAPLMPAWGAILKADEIKAAASYVWDAAGAGKGGGGSPAATTPTAAAPTPLAKITPSVAVGKEIFTNICSMCHGLDGMNQKNCPLGSRQWLSNQSTESLMAKIRNGKPASGMPTWGASRGGSLSEEQIFSVVMYLGEMAR